ncbi:MAG: c-type cytochrome [Planctomycetaceae bacterium]|nr:c-type cytochrome [Planctomycetaceae bacterium]
MPRSRNVALAVFVLMVPLWSSGCRKAPAEEFTLSDAIRALPGELQVAARTELREHCGSFSAPKLLGNDEISVEHLRAGQAVYQQQCAQCHGTTGDGNGPVGGFLYPRPRDYRKGIFKFTSTRYGSKPLRDDLVRTVRQGVAGTAMPSFKLLPQEQLDAVIDYVLVLTHRGELEEQIAAVADADGELAPEIVDDDLVPLILSRWAEARESIITPVTPEPEFTTERALLGRTAFLEKGCSKCHGDDGRAQTAEDPTKEDAWGNITRPADLTSGMLRGGRTPTDIYRRIHGGINGTAMPAFDQSLKDEPDTVWNMVAYVLYVTDRRRDGESPAPGYLRPYLPPTNDKP